MHRYLCAAITPDVDLVLIGGNGFRAVGAIRAAEADTGVPIVSANTALLWWTLQTMGRPTDQVSSYGRLFTS
jgi:maleate isomerase